MAESWGQKQVVEASHLVVFAVKKSLNEQDIDYFLKRVSEVRGVSIGTLSDYRGFMVGTIIKGMDDAGRKDWATKQVYIALGNLLTSAAMLGIDACPMEGINPAKYDEILGLDKQGLATAVAATVGYRAATCKYAAVKKVRFHKDEVIIKI